jgi:hypothetical protein
MVYHYSFPLSAYGKAVKKLAMRRRSRNRTMTQQASLLLGLLKHAADSVLEVRNTMVNSSRVPEFPCGIIKFFIQLMMLFCLPCSLWISWTSHYLKVLSGHCNISARDLLNKEGGQRAAYCRCFLIG